MVSVRLATVVGRSSSVSAETVGVSVGSCLHSVGVSRDEPSRHCLLFDLLEGAAALFIIFLTSNRKPFPINIKAPLYKGVGVFY